MGKTLAELKASPDTGRPERVFAICVAGKLVAELDAADKILFAAESKLASSQAKLDRATDEAEANSGGGVPLKRLGSPAVIPALVDEVTAAEAEADAAAATCDSIRARMEDHMLDLHFSHSEQWSQWRSQHPARDEEDDRAGFLLDTRWAGGLCDVDALAQNLGLFVTAYGDEPPAEGSWEFVRDNSNLGDRRQAASLVVSVHEQVVDLGKSRAVWRADQKTLTASE